MGRGGCSRPSLQKDRLHVSVCLYSCYDNWIIRVMSPFLYQIRIRRTVWNSVLNKYLLSNSELGLASCQHFWKVIIIIIIITNIKDLTLWSVPSPKLQLLSPTFLRSSNCSPSLWSVVVWFQRDSALVVAERSGWRWVLGASKPRLSAKGAHPYRKRACLEALRLPTTKLTQRGTGYPS